MNEDTYSTTYSTSGSWTSGIASAVTASMGTITGQVMWDGKPVIDDDDGGSSPVREPRRPRPSAPAGSAALEIEQELTLV